MCLLFPVHMRGAIIALFIKQLGVSTRHVASPLSIVNQHYKTLQEHREESCTA